MDKHTIMSQRRFWGWAKDKEHVIPDNEFRDGFLDILKNYAGSEIDFDSLFDPDTGGFKDKTSYSVIKQLRDKRAKERSDTDPKEDIDYAIMALAKFWSMQFIDNRKLYTVYSKEWQAAHAEERAKAAAEEDARQQAERKNLSVKIKALQDKATAELPKAKKRIEEKVAEVIERKLAEFKPICEKARADAEAINNMQVDFTYNPDLAKRYSKIDLDKTVPTVDKIDWTVEVGIELDGSKLDPDENGRYDRIRKYIVLMGLVRVPEYSDDIYATRTYEEISLDNPDIDKAIEEIADDLAHRVDITVEYPYKKEKYISTIDKVIETERKLYEDYMAKVNLSKQAAIDAEAGRSTADFEATVAEAMKGVEKYANSEAAEWRGLSIDDGDSGLAYHQGLIKGSYKLIPYLAYCNWTAKDIQGYPISCKVGSSYNTVEDAAIELGYKGSDFKVVPSTEIETPGNTLADSADYTSELIKDYDEAE